MKRIGNQFRDISYLMYNEVRLFVLPFGILLLVLLLLHGIAILSYQGISVPYSAFYYSQAFLFKGVLLISVGWLLFVSLKQLPIGRNQQRIKSYMLLPTSRGNIIAARWLSVACAFLALLLAVIFYYLIGYALMMQLHPDMQLPNGLGKAVEEASYLRLYLPQSAHDVWITATLLCTITSFVTIGFRAFRYLRKNIVFVLLMLVPVLMLVIYISSYIYFYRSEEMSQQLAELVYKLFMNDTYLWLLMGWNVIALLNAWRNARAARV